MPKRKQAQKVPVTVRALIQRINRKLAQEDKRLVKTRENALTGNGVPLVHDLGRYYAIDVGRNQMADTHVDPEKLGRQLGVMQPWEKLADDGGTVA
jgi:hypothetical protein